MAQTSLKRDSHPNTTQTCISRFEAAVLAARDYLHLVLNHSTLPGPIAVRLQIADTVEATPRSVTAE
jgi:hypothetical protein